MVGAGPRRRSTCCAGRPSEPTSRSTSWRRRSSP